MKKFFAVLVFVLACCIVSLAQTNQNLPCPTVNVTGPSGPTQPGERVTFTAQVTGNTQNSDIKYEWMVAGGEIVEGQGTPSITASQKELGGNLTAAVTIKGLPDNCGMISDAETATPFCSISSIIIDEFSISVREISEDRLDGLATGLRNDPTAAGYILERFKRGTSESLIKQKLQKIYDYFVRAGVEKDRIVIKTVFSDQNFTVFYIVPAGAQEPTIEDN